MTEESRDVRIAELTARIEEKIVFDPPFDPQTPPPAGVVRADTWDIPVGTISVRRRNEGAVTANDLYMEAPLLSGMSGYAKEWDDEVISCPTCGQAEELHLRGGWDVPARIICAQGHSWLYTANDAAGVAAMRQAITTAAAAMASQPEE